MTSLEGVTLQATRLDQPSSASDDDSISPLALFPFRILANTRKAEFELTNMSEYFLQTGASLASVTLWRSLAVLDHNDSSLLFEVTMSRSGALEYCRLSPFCIALEVLQYGQ